MSYIVAGVEAGALIPNKYSMVCFGAVVVEPSLLKTFYGKIKSESKEWIPEALAVSGFSRVQHESFLDPELAMNNFADWLLESSAGKPIFVSDNPAFDWQWIKYFFLHLHVNQFTKISSVKTHPF